MINTNETHFTFVWELLFFLSWDVKTSIRIWFLTTKRSKEVKYWIMNSEYGENTTFSRKQWWQQRNDEHSSSPHHCSNKYRNFPLAQRKYLLDVRNQFSPKSKIVWCHLRRKTFVLNCDNRFFFFHVGSNKLSRIQYVTLYTVRFHVEKKRLT